MRRRANHAIMSSNGSSHAFQEAGLLTTLRQDAKLHLVSTPDLRVLKSSNQIRRPQYRGLLFEVEIANLRIRM